MNTNKLNAWFRLALEEDQQEFSCFVKTETSPTDEQKTELISLGCRHIINQIFTATLTRENVGKVSDLDYVRYLELSRPLHPC